jgi:glycosyltransferase involved in cell wall biosynthesis
MIEHRCVDLLYLSSNRLEFTRETFSTLLRNTDWRFVRELVVNDNNSVDGTREWLEQAVRQAPVPVRYIKANHLSPVTAMLQFIASGRAPVLAKVDNDTMVPPGWLRLSLEALERHPELALLGIEAFHPHSDDLQLPRSYVPAEFISGLGLYKRSVFARSRPRAIGKWFGFEEWQVAQGSSLVRGWINPALCIFLLDRIPFEPWLSYSDMYIARGWQRSWPKYDPNCTLWQWRWNGEQKDLAPVMGLGDSRFVCAMRIKNEAAHIREVLFQALRLCHRAVIFDDHSTDETVSICESFGDAVTVFRSPFEGLDEARDKNFLLEKLVPENPEWVLWIDGDEVLENTGPDKIRTAVAQSPGAAAWYLRISYLWDDPQKVRMDGLFGNFRRLSLFRLRGQNINQFKFRSTGNGGNFHCGNVPEGLVGEHRDLPVRLKHFGYLTKQQRLAKYAFYTKVDPNNQLEDNYRHLAEIRGARHAPGPIRLVPWIE